MADALRAHYAALDERFNPRVDSNYDRLVVASDNAEEPIHRWFRMKEAFSPHLLRRLLKDLDLSGAHSLRVLDPFAGSGTTLLSALEWGAEHGADIEATGYEINPFLHLVAVVKTSLAAHDDATRLALADDLARSSARALDYSGPFEPPPMLNAFQDARYFPEPQLTPLLQLRAAVDETPGEEVRNLLRVALASCLEPCSYLRRDGRALRYVPARQPRPVREAFAGIIIRMIRDIKLATLRGSATVELQDARDGDSTRAVPAFDLAVFSPPYPNNIDYTEVYKLEAWFLRLIESQEAFRSQRLSTVRSHPSLSWAHVSPDLPPQVAATVRDLTGPVVMEVPRDRYRGQREQLIRGYLEDAARVMLRLHGELRLGASAVYIVGNSRHGATRSSFIIASDLLLAAVAETCGFRVDSIRVARRLSRRGHDPLLRESVVILTKE